MVAHRENEIAVSIPLRHVERIQIYQNPVNPKTRKRKTLATIMKETGADYAINGTLYNMRTGESVCPLKADGRTYFTGQFKYQGYAWQTLYPQTFKLDIIPNVQYNNFIACANIVKCGKAIEKPIYNAAQGSYRARSAIGTKRVNGENRICFYACTEKKGIRKSPEQLGKLLQSYGWDDAVMLDCGGSSQAYFRKEKRQIYSIRRVAHYILVYLKKEYK